VRSQEDDDDDDDDEPGDFDESEPVPTASSLSADPGERPLGIMVCPPVESRPPCHRPARPKRLVGPGWPPPEAARGIPERPFDPWLPPPAALGGPHQREIAC
jgi:hypothetical protein